MHSMQTRRNWRRGAALGCGVVVGFLCISALRQPPYDEPRARRLQDWDGEKVRPDGTGVRPLRCFQGYHCAAAAAARSAASRRARMVAASGVVLSCVDDCERLARRVYVRRADKIVQPSWQFSQIGRARFVLLAVCVSLEDRGCDRRMWKLSLPSRPLAESTHCQNETNVATAEMRGSTDSARSSQDASEDSV